MGEETHAPRGEAGDRLERVDWEGIERSPEFQELVRRRRAFVLPATIFFLAWYMGFILLAAYAPDFMAERVYQGLTVGYVLALTQFVMVVVLGLAYLSRSSKVYDPLAERAVEGHVAPDPEDRRGAAGARAASAGGGAVR
jgi:uncharacterized membrane protein (DUF485 family)